MKIVDRSTLPPFNAAETDGLDWKMRVDAGKRQEMVKDMAAMANASGGSIVIGIKEGSTVVAAALHPMSHAEVLQLARAYEQAAKEWISPPPKVDAAPIEVECDGSGKWILAVNVSPTEAIFCAAKTINDGTGQSKDPTWLIPRRVASQTKYLSPAEAQLLTVEKLRSTTQQTLALIEKWQNDLRLREEVRRFEKFMANESHHDIRLPELATDKRRLGLEYTIRPVRDGQGVALHDKGEMRSRWVVEVVGPAQESVMKAEDLEEYESSPIRDGEYYYCEFYNDSWHLGDGGLSNAYSFYLSGKVGPVEHLEDANDFVDRRRGTQDDELKKLFQMVLDLEGRRLRDAGGGNLFVVLTDPAEQLFLRINNSPPKRMYHTTTPDTRDGPNWRFEIEKLRGHGRKHVRTNIRESIREELQRRGIPIPKVPWHKTYRSGQ